MNLNNCDLLFYKGGGPNLGWGLRFVQWAIKRITKSPYCHVGILLDSSDKRTVGEAWTTGFKIHDYYTYLDKEIDDGRIIVKRYKGLTDVQKRKIVSHIESFKDTPYDFLDILDLFIHSVFGIRTEMGDPNKLICSESVDLAFKMEDIDLVPEYPSDETDPGDLARSELLTRVK